MSPGNGVQGYNEFELDIESILRAQIPEYFDQISDAPLTQSNVLALPEKAKGAYLLLHQNTVVYAGKTDARNGFRDRLLRHWGTLQHRKNLKIADISFKAVRIMVFSNFDIETILIEALRKRDKANLRWNDSGFGSNDPGHNRESQEPAKFDVDYPIDMDHPLENVVQAGEYILRDLLVQAKDRLPFLLRYETDEKSRTGQKVLYERHTVGHADQRKVKVTVPSATPTMRELMTIAVKALPGWRVTVFPGRVILYRDHGDYKFATEYIA